MEEPGPSVWKNGFGKMGLGKWAWENWRKVCNAPACDGVMRPGERLGQNRVGAAPSRSGGRSLRVFLGAGRAFAKTSELQAAPAWAATALEREVAPAPRP